MVNRRHSFPGVGVEQHRGGVVVAVGAQRPAQPRVVLGVAEGAGDVSAVRAAAGVLVAAGSAGQDGFAAHPPGVDRAERGRGEGREHARVGRDRLGDALATGQPGADELAGVALVHLRAGRADGLAAVAARQQQHSPGLIGGRVDGPDFAGGKVDRADAALDLHRVIAAAGVVELLLPSCEVVADAGGGVVGGRSRPRAVIWSGGEGDRRGGHGR